MFQTKSLSTLFFAEMIVATRASLALSQRGLARVLGCSQSLVNRWEQGRRPPSARYLYKIQALNWDLWKPVPTQAQAPAPAQPPAQDF